jgi:hypothetical protein
MSIFTSPFIITQKYNDLHYDVDLYLDSKGNYQNEEYFVKSKKYNINPASVISLNIIDSINDWVADGEMTFLMSITNQENFNSEATGQPADVVTNVNPKEKLIFKNFQFRGDGYDLLRVLICPKTSVGGPENVSLGKQNPKWQLSYIFSIYDIEDINDFPTLAGQASSYLKCIKVKFHDLRYQIMKTSNIEYSTSLPKDETLKPNFETGIAKTLGVLPTGQILRDIFNYTLASSELGGIQEFKIKNNAEWDIGSSNLFYTSPAQYTAFDDVEYILSHHISSKNLITPNQTTTQLKDMCMLHTSRGKNFGELESLSLTPLQDFFNKAGNTYDTSGPLLKERFYVTKLTSEASSITEMKSPLMNSNNIDKDIKTTKYGRILSFCLTDMPGSINSEEFRTTPIYSVDIARRQFNIDFNGNDIITAKKAIAKTYISNLYKKGEDESVSLHTLHVRKKDFNVFPEFSLHGNNKVVRQAKGLHQLLYTGLFQGTSIIFQTLGLTSRESGTFISIEETDGSEDNDVANKLYGQWFVTRVEHMFQSNSYFNMIYAVKLHRFRPLINKFEDTI